MNSDRTRTVAKISSSPTARELLKQYACGPVQLTGASNALYERHLMFDTFMDPKAIGPR